MSNYFDFKNIFTPSVVVETQNTSISRVSSNISSLAFSDDLSSGILSDSSSPGYSDSEDEDFKSEKFKKSKIIYQVTGIVINQSYSDSTEWWVVNIKDFEQIKKFNNPELVEITGLFANTCEKKILIGSQVQVELTYSSNGSCLWQENKIIEILPNN